MTIMEKQYLPGLTDQKFLNALTDGSTEFVLVPTPALRELMTKDENPIVKKLPYRYKLTFMNCPQNAGVQIDRELVKRYVNGLSPNDEKFILDRCDILCVGHSDINKKTIIR